MAILKTIKQQLLDRPKPPEPSEKQKQSSRKHSNKKQKGEKKKRVSFSDEADGMRQIDKFENRHDLWYTNRDADQFAARDYQMGLLLRRMSPAELEVRTGQSSRGLEFRQGDLEQSSRHRRRSSLLAVLKTQELFQAQAKDGHDSIARAYALAGAGAIEQAISLAGGDEQFVVDHVRGKTGIDCCKLEEKQRRSLRPSVLERQNAFRPLVVVGEQ